MLFENKYDVSCTLKYEFTPLEMELNLLLLKITRWLIDYLHLTTSPANEFLFTTCFILLNLH